MSEKYDQGQRKREKKTQSLLIMDQSYITNYIYTNIIEHKDKKQWINEYLPLRGMSAYLCFQIRLLRQTNVTTSGLKFTCLKRGNTHFEEF